jgi:hypothetical protein
MSSTTKMLACHAPSQLLTKISHRISCF